MDCPHILNLFYLLKINFKTLKTKCLFNENTAETWPPVMLKQFRSSFCDLILYKLHAQSTQRRIGTKISTWVFSFYREGILQLNPNSCTYFKTS